MNYYVLVHESDDMDSVAFVDCCEDFEEIAYVMVSNLWAFLRYFIVGRVNRSSSAFDKNDSTETPWPFNKEETIANDPEIQNSKLPLPWGDFDSVIVP